MPEKPILFSGPMVRAIIEGRKTQTRRVIKPQPVVEQNGTVHFPWATFFPNGHVHTWDRNGVGGENWDANRYPDENKFLQALLRTPYENPSPYQPGDILCVKETWAETCDEYGSPIIVYRADNAAFYIGEKQILAPCEAAWSLDSYPACGKWRPSIFLPKWAWRIKSPVISVRPERLQDITEEDAKAEGVTLLPQHINLIHSFWTLWDSINGKKHPWESNPWVWRYGFRKRENPKHV
ncbi:MAG: hypothetical protein A4E60_00158 [Syntrophorhabdus sp. PtaB.Bin047]|nr:MAG: hypothetical protein A4E60_00158 [Syntrophorhabdus sp. PtaB.Bin047]